MNSKIAKINVYTLRSQKLQQSSPCRCGGPVACGANRLIPRMMSPIQITEETIAASEFLLSCDIRAP